MTPLATPTVGLSKRTTPRSSFTNFDRSKPLNSANLAAHFDLAKLLDPFEQLEREFNWEDVTIRPPSAFSSMVDINESNQETIAEDTTDDAENNSKRYTDIRTRWFMHKGQNTVLPLTISAL